MSSGGLACNVRLRLGLLDLDVDFSVEPGELVVLVGPNGAGKSTLLRVIAGLQALDHGRVALDGESLDEPGAGRFVPARERSIGVVFQERLLFDHMTVIDNVAFGLRSRGAQRRDARRVATQWLERLGVAQLGGLRPAQLSGGQAQRVALGRALAFEPRLLLLDEPFSALDATTRAGVRRDLRRHLATLDIPRIIVTHDPVDAITLADRIVVLEAGHVTQHGRPDDVLTRPRSRYVADLIGVNLLRGTRRDGVIELPGGHCIAAVAPVEPVDAVELQGPVTVTIHPHAITLHRAQPAGSARNAWATTIDDLDDEGDRVRVRVGSPVPLVVEITSSARTELALVRGAPVWVSFKATEVTVQPD